MSRPAFGVTAASYRALDGPVGATMMHLHTAGDLHLLADDLAEVLSVTPGDPMEPEVVAVASAGMRTWLSLQLARHLGTGTDPGVIGSEGVDPGTGGRSDGVSANIEFPFPGFLRPRVLEAEGSIEHDSDPWELHRLCWRILEVADRERASGGSARTLPALLVEAPAGDSRWAAARRVADLFDRYHLHRPAMVRSWAAGADVDGVGGPLVEHHLWQPRLWRTLRTELAVASPPERMASALERLRAGDLEVDLPNRICVFGMSLLPGGPGFVELAAALATGREVHLFVVEPSPVLRRRFTSVVGATDGARTTTGGTPHRLRREVDTSVLHHPLLRSWGRMHYETASVLADALSTGLMSVSERSRGVTGSAGHTDPVHPAEPNGETLLGMLKQRIREDTAADGSIGPTHPALAPADGHARTVEFHACHGPTRQVEVMRDTVLRLLNEHPHLQEDDILVVCPDLDRFAPLVEATLGPSAHTGAAVDPAAAIPSLRYRLADRSLGSSIPLVSSFMTLLELVAGRFDAPSVLDFLALDPVRRRFRLDDDDLATITQWVLDVHVRWGLDPAGRERFGVPASVVTNTWTSGVDRILLGAAVAGPPSGVGGSGALTDTIGSVVPHGVEGSDVAVGGALAEILWYLGELAAELGCDRPVGEWIDLLWRAATDLFSVDREQRWQFDRLERSLEELVESSVQPRPGPHRVAPTPLGFTDMRRALEDRLGSVEGRPSFMRGGVTISSLTPLRWVPHRVIVMLGMDSAALGSGTSDGDDLAAADPLVGDRDRRNELRQSMLETVLSAEEHLVIIRTGHDVRTNQPVPMPVAVAELRDAVAAMVAPAHREDFLAGLETCHPRQPFDEAYFLDPDREGGSSGSSARGVPRSFDRRSLEGAVSRRGRADTAGDYLAAPLDQPGIEEVNLTELHRFCRNPIRCFVERRLEMRLPREGDVPLGTLPASVPGLDVYALGDRLLGLIADLGDVDSAVAAWWESEVRVGSVPAGRIGELELRKVELQVRDLHRQCADAGVDLGDPGTALEVDLATSGGTRVVGTVRARLAPTDTTAGGPALVRFVKRRPEHLLSAWLDLAALTLSDPGRRWRSVAATRAEKGTHTLEGVSRLPKVEVTTLLLEDQDPQAAALRALDTVVDLYLRGMCEPLPLFRKLSERAFSSPGSTPEWPDAFADEAEMLVFGHLSAADLRRLPVHDDDPPGVAGDRLARYAEHLFGTVAQTTARPGPPGANRAGSGGGGR